MYYDKIEVGKRVENIRIKLRMNKEQFATLIGCSAQHLGSIEKGIVGLSIERLIEICKISKASSDYILFGNQLDIKDSLSKYSPKDIEVTKEIIDLISSNLN